MKKEKNIHYFTSIYKWENSVDNISNLHKKKKIQRRREASEYDADRRRKAPEDLLVRNIMIVLLFKRERLMNHMNNMIITFLLQKQFAGLLHFD